jgi:hypothetical protein
MKRTALALLIASAAHAGVPKVFSYTGTLADAAGNPAADNSYGFTFRLFGTVTGGDPLWESTYNVPTVSGVFTALLGPNAVPLDPSLFARPQVWLEVEVEGDTLSPRLRVVSVPYALSAASLDCQGCVAADQVDPGKVQLRVSGTCGVGQAVAAINDNGTVVCINVGSGGGITAGAGIEVTSGVVSTSFADQSCPFGYKVDGFDASGNFTCSVDATGGSLAGFSCPNGQHVFGWDGSGATQCTDDTGGAGGGVTQITAGMGLLATPNPITSTGTLSIAPNGVQTSMIAAGAVSDEVGVADLGPLCTGGTLDPDGTCTIGMPTVVLFSRTILEAGLYLFFVHLDTVSTSAVGGTALGLQLNNVTANVSVDPASFAETWDYDLVNTNDLRTIARTFIYDKTTAGLETLEIRAWTDGGVVTVAGYAMGLGGWGSGMHAIVLKR